MPLFSRKKKQSLKNDDKDILAQNDTSEVSFKELGIEEASLFVRERILDETNTDEVLQQRERFLRLAMAGDVPARQNIEKIILRILDENKIIVPGLTADKIAMRIFADNWGLGVLEEYYRQKDVEEIRVNSPSSIFIQRYGKNEKLSVSFKHEQEVETVIKRMIAEDIGAFLDRSNPRLESVRLDGTRITATCPPVSKTWSFVLRKHGTFEVSVENLIAFGTLNQKVWDILSVLVNGRANILFSGNVGSGKTTLLRRLAGEIHPNLRVLVIGKDLELLLAKHYPERDIIELEEHAHVGASMKKLFETALRESPDIIIIEEFRGTGEAIEAIKACTRGLPGSMATAHFNSPEEAIEGTAMLMLEEGLDISLKMAKLRVARAFDIVVQMFGDTVSGTRKIVQISEIIIEGEHVYTNDLVRWKPAGDSFTGEGDWEIVGIPSKPLMSKMTRFVPSYEIMKRFQS